MAAHGYEEIEHTADWSIRVWGEDLAGLFTSAAEGMFHLLGAEPTAARGQWRPFELRAEDPESLLVAWLGELLFDLEVESVIYEDFDLKIPTGERLDGRARQLPSNRPRKEIKAVTYHNLAIKETDRGLEMVVVFDV